MRIYFYYGAEGKTIRLQPDSRDDLVDLRKLFCAVADSSDMSLVQAMKPSVMELRDIEIVRIPHRSEREAEVREISPHLFRWIADERDLERYTGLIDGLLRYTGTAEAYQLLTAPSSLAGITVEVVSAAAMGTLTKDGVG